jgi:hypothetical protein
MNPEHPAAQNNGLTPKERFLFDLQGYLLVPSVLPSGLVDDLNAAIDSHPEYLAYNAVGTGRRDAKALAGSRRRQGLKVNPLQFPGKDAEPFQALVAWASARPYLNALLGRGWRLDSAPEIVLSEKGADGLIMHGAGSRWFSQSGYYTYANDVMRCGLVIVEYPLTDQGPGDGGFACMPGSHKANYEAPLSIRKWEECQEVVRQVNMEAGDMLVFCEALLHGTLPWAADHPRRVLLLRYTCKVTNLAPAGSSLHVTTAPAWMSDLPADTRAALEPAYAGRRPVLGADGTVDFVDDPY